MKKLFKNIGPATLVTAAFIGPGTVITCTKAGAGFGFALLWAMLLSIIATVVLQEMAARLGVVTQKGLAEVIRSAIPSTIVRILAIILLIAAILIGNAAYEGGNISGGVVGLDMIFGKSTYYPVLLGFLAFLLLFFGSYKILERVFIALVLLMSISFLITAIISKPDLSQLLKGMFVPSFPENSFILIVGLIGTTVVPYNLFLHASLVKERWKTKEDLPKARLDTYIAVGVGGLVSLCIIISAVGIQNVTIQNGEDLAKGLAPLYEDWAQYFLGIGLLAAGITSAITAPLAAAYVAKGCLGWQDGLKSWRFRIVWILVLISGVLFSSLGIKPLEVITFAQLSNGLLLPITAIFLLWMVNKTSLMGDFRNKPWQNVLGVVIVGIAIFLGAKAILQVFSLL